MGFLHPHLPYLSVTEDIACRHRSKKLIFCDNFYNLGGKGGKFDENKFEGDRGKREKGMDDCASQVKKHIIVLTWAGIGAGFVILGVRLPMIRSKISYRLRF